MTPPTITITVTLTNASTVTVTMRVGSGFGDAKNFLMEMHAIGGFFDDAGVWHSSSVVLSASIAQS